jgi:hypothetical protein
MEKFYTYKGNDYWPTRYEVLIAALLGVVVVAVDIFLSQRIGLLTIPPRYDGVEYMFGSKSAYYAVTSSLQHLSSSLQQLANNWSLLHSPLWVTLMTVNFFIFGEGEWQCYIVRFWPAFLFILLVVWLMRRRCGALVAWCCAFFTALLPTFSISLNASVRGRYGYADGSTLYMGDLRPDLLCAVLLLCAVGLLVEHAKKLTRRTALVFGALAGCAVLCKPSTMPGLLLALGLVTLYVIGINYKSLRRTITTCLWGLTPFGVLLFGYILAGGYEHVVGYIYIGLVTNAAVFSLPDTSLVSTTKYHWKWFYYHIGVEGWLVVGIGALSFVLFALKRKGLDLTAVAFLGLAIAWYLLITNIGSTNEFLNLPCYLALWLFGLIASAPVIRLVEQQSHMRLVLPIVTCVFTLVMISQGIRFLSSYAREPVETSLQQRATIERIADDLRAELNSGDFFVAADWYHFTGGSLPYYTVNSEGGMFFPLIWEAANQNDKIIPFIENEVSKRKVVLTYKEDIAEVCEYTGAALPTSYPYYRELNRWIRQPGNQYQLLKEYPLAFPRGHTLTLQMYVKH